MGKVRYVGLGWREWGGFEMAALAVGLFGVFGCDRSVGGIESRGLAGLSGLAEVLRIGVWQSHGWQKSFRWEVWNGWRARGIRANRSSGRGGGSAEVCGSCETKFFCGSVPGNMRGMWRAKVQRNGWSSFITTAREGKRTRETLDRVPGADTRRSERVSRKAGACAAIEMLTGRLKLVTWGALLIV